MRAVGMYPTIDLGVLDRSESETESAERPVWRGWSVLLSVAMLALLTSAVRFPGGLVPVGGAQLVPGSYQMLGGVLVAIGGQRTANPVIALDVVDGTRRWYVGPSRARPFQRVTLAGTVALLETDHCVRYAAPTTVAVDASTGAERWSRLGTPMPPLARAPANGGPQLAIVQRAGLPDLCGVLVAGEEKPLTTDVRWEAVEPETGVVRWERTIPAGLRVVPATGPGGWAAVVAPDGAISVVELSTGNLSVAGALPDLAGAVLGDPQAPHAVGVGDVLVVSRFTPTTAPRGARSIEFDGYDRRTLTRRWTVRAPGPAWARVDALELATAFPCGALVCLAAGETTAVDPVSGRARWRVPRADFTHASGGLIVDQPWRGDRPPAGGLTLLDPVDGSTKAALPDWYPLGHDPETGRTVVGLRSGFRTYFGWLRAGASAGRRGSAMVSVIDSVDGWFTGCVVAGDRLACRSQLDGIRIWRIRP